MSKSNILVNIMALSRKKSSKNFGIGPKNEKTEADEEEEVRSLAKELKEEMKGRERIEEMTNELVNFTAFKSLRLWWKFLPFLIQS